MSWNAMPLKYACIDSGQYGLNVSADYYSDSGIRLIRTSDVNEFGGLRGDVSPVYVDVPLEGRHRLRPGDILLSRSGTLGRSLLVPGLREESTYAGYLVRFRPKPEVDPRFLSYSCMSIPFQEKIRSDAVSSTIQNFNAERYANIRIHFPAPGEQRRIADFLDAEVGQTDQVVEARLRQMELLEERSRLVVDHEIDRLASKWDVTSFRRMIRNIEQGSSPQCESIPARVGEWGVLKLSSIKRGKFHPSENKKLPEGVEADVRFRLSSGDLLVTRANTPELVGDAAVVQGDSNNLLLSDLVYRIDLDESVDANYLCAVIRGSRVRGLIQSAARGSSQSMVKLRGEDIRSWEIPAANQREQMGFVLRIKNQQDEVETTLSKIGRQVELLEERKRALITAAVTGQIDVTTARGADLS